MLCIDQPNQLVLHAQCGSLLSCLPFYLPEAIRNGYQSVTWLHPCLEIKYKQCLKITRLFIYFFICCANPVVCMLAPVLITHFLFFSNYNLSDTLVLSQCEDIEQYKSGFNYHCVMLDRDLEFRSFFLPVHV